MRSLSFDNGKTVSSANRRERGKRANGVWRLRFAPAHKCVRNELNKSECKRNQRPLHRLRERTPNPSFPWHWAHLFMVASLECRRSWGLENPRLKMRLMVSGGCGINGRGLTDSARNREPSTVSRSARRLSSNRRCSFLRPSWSKTMAKEELKWQNIDADDLPSAVKVDLIRHWRQGRPAKLHSVCRCSLQPMFGLDQPPAPWRLVRLEARRDAHFSSGVVQS